MLRLPSMEFLSGLYSVYAKALLPALLLCCTGAAAFRYLGLDRQTVSRLTVYVFLPPLLFNSLMKVDAGGGEVGRVALFGLGLLAAMALAGLCYARLFRIGDPGSYVLSATFFNAVNLGFPFSLLVYGEEGLQLAGLLVAVNSLPHNGFAVYVAARGRMSGRQALATLLRMPILYAILLAVLMRWSGLSVPSLLQEPLDQLGAAAIPAILICVGMEIATLRIGRIDPGLAGLVMLRLAGGPLAAWGLTLLLDIGGLLQPVLILLAGMPSAMAPVVYARMFGGSAEPLAQAVLWSTLASGVTLPILVSLLPRGAG